MKLASYWLETAPPFTAGSPGPSEGRYDVAVVGAGFTGLSAALALSKRGARVAVLEAEGVGGAASGRNGGQCNNGFASDYRAIAARFGEERAAALYHAYDAAVDSVERLVREEGIDCDFRRTGKIKLAAKPEHFDKLQRTYEALSPRADPDTHLVPASAIRGEVGSDAFYGGLVYAKSGGMHVGKFARGLARAAAGHGAAVFENAPVTRLRRLSGTAHEVTTSRGTLTANQVLMATGASTVGPLGWFRRRIVPVGSFVIVTEPLPRDVLDRLMPTRRMATNTKNVGTYFRVTPDDRLLFGGRARFAVSNPLSDEKSGRVLRRALDQVFPELARVRIDYCWGGVVDMTADRLPRAGVRDGLYYSMGYSGHGTQMATHMGQVMAEVLEGRAERNPFAGWDWKAIPGHFGPPWFLPFVGAYYRLQDVLH
ncbi:Glycine/D-amino acid oxidase [Methylobacterium sp. ap11]|uniref:NAD(P)/FAD-dependent oxidoreductase n=1 Tax=Methylobacterium sp. ap11 TaxID=1761799 RepID=UPI0008CDC3E4|nr:FAD-binding oxidoreductase [Methylobacterium sp. ap11]SEP20132.1 Glycine/D-amino acid oxidase [Methylobacterium sp. ap11]